MKKKITISVLALLISSIAIVEWTSSYTFYEEPQFASIYYRDTLSVADIEDYYNIKVMGCSNGLSCTDGKIYVRLMDSINPLNDELNQTIYGRDKDDNTIEKSLKIRCWINNTYRLEEISPMHDGAIVRNVKRVWKKVLEKTVGYNYETILLTQNDTSYIAKDGKIFVLTVKGLTPICDFKLEDPIYNQMIKIGNIAFIRTGYSIYYSNDNLTSWKQIYHGKRAISRSMYFSGSSLIFSQYTPGNVRERHYVLEYSLELNQIDTIQTFYTESEHNEKGLTPYCRHIHILEPDPFTGDIYIGTGDSDGESSIFISRDKGRTFHRLVGGTQNYRTLAFIFTKDYVFWNNDTSRPQYLCRLSRNEIDSLYSLGENYNAIYDVTKFPLYQSALWSLVYNPDFDMFIMSSNNEGSLYDNNHYTFGVKISDDGIPMFYNLLSEYSLDYPYHQLFILGCDRGGVIYGYDTRYRRLRKFKIYKVNSNE